MAGLPTVPQKGGRETGPGRVRFTIVFLKMLVYLLNNPGRLEPVLLFSATNYTNFTNFPLFFVLIREICPESPKDSWLVFAVLHDLPSLFEKIRVGSLVKRKIYRQGANRRCGQAVPTTPSFPEFSLRLGVLAV